VGGLKELPFLSQLIVIVDSAIVVKVIVPGIAGSVAVEATTVAVLGILSTLTARV
jgi:hypothetical protein